MSKLNLKDVTPQAVLAAYAKTGLTPVRGTWVESHSPTEFEIEKCGCALSAYVIANTDIKFEDMLFNDGDTDSAQKVTKIMEDAFGLDKYEIFAFTNGFDDYDISGEIWPEERVQLYKKGQEVNKEVFGE